ncbi:unnamed protein product [Brassica rapa subsp. narinosa]
MLTDNMGFLNSKIATEQLNLNKNKKTNMSKRAHEARQKKGRVTHWFRYNRPVFLPYPTAWFVAVFSKIIIIHHHIYHP